MSAYLAAEETPTPSMRLANKTSHMWVTSSTMTHVLTAPQEHEHSGPTVGMCQVGCMCHQPYTLPTNSDQTWEEVWKSLSEHTRQSSSRSSDEGNLTDEALTESLTDEAPTESAESDDLVGKFPVAQHGRCPHRQYWDRLRGKRGHSYFVCRLCGIGWRQQTKVANLKQAASGSKVQHQRKSHTKC